MAISDLDFDSALALLEWQADLGASEAIVDAPINRYETPSERPQPHPLSPASQSQQTDPVAIAKSAAAQAQDLGSLKAAIASFEACELKRGARNMVFADGNPQARVMIIGEAPGRDEDQQGKPFTGPAGRLLDAMFSAIDHGRDQVENALYIINILPWRPPQDRVPKLDEIAMMLPFVERHVALSNPDVVVLMGNVSCHALLGQKAITRLRGRWHRAFDRPALAMFHPDYLLRNPAAKREAWQDLLQLKQHLKETPQ